MSGLPLTGSVFLDSGKTPDEWAEKMQARGYKITARTIREKANELNARGKLGDVYLITPEQIDIILMGVLPCHLKSANEATNGSSTVASNTTASPSQATTITEALDHLRKQERSNGVRPKRLTRSGVISLAKKQKGPHS